MNDLKLSDRIQAHYDQNRDFHEPDQPFDLVRAVRALEEQVDNLDNTEFRSGFDVGDAMNVYIVGYHDIDEETFVLLAAFTEEKAAKKYMGKNPYGEIVEVPFNPGLPDRFPQHDPDSEPHRGR